MSVQIDFRRSQSFVHDLLKKFVDGFGTNRPYTRITIHNVKDPESKQSLWDPNPTISHSFSLFFNVKYLLLPSIITWTTLFDPPTKV